MRTKLGTGVLVAAVAFLVATNPVVVEAAGQITSGQIKNETIKSKDIKNGQVKSADVKNGSLQATDLAAGAVPVEVKAFERFAGGSDTPLATTVAPVFYGPTVQIEVDADDVVVASASTMVLANADGDDYSYGLCSRPVGSSAAPTPMGGLPAMFEDVDALSGQNVASSDASAVLAAGSHTVGWCARGISGTTTFAHVSGWVQVLGGSTGGL
jgi:hypothetical protein